MKRKVVLITGASRGLGASIARKFASLNYDVVINFLKSFDEAKKLKEEIEDKYKVNVLNIKCDVAEEENVKEMVNEVINKFGRIDCLVNNAGIAIDSLPEEKTSKDFRRILDVNLIGTFLVSREVAKYMSSGNIINISSTNGIDTYYSYSLDYDASKSGVISLTHNLSNLYAPNIRVNCVAPGWINTDMNKELDKDYIKEEENKILLKRFASSEEIANVVAFLASDDASYVNDSIIRVDGGVDRK
jgi:3-oxoacyl-[acyl-carrier protein] reductase